MRTGLYTATLYHSRRRGRDIDQQQHVCRAESGTLTPRTAYRSAPAGRPRRCTDSSCGTDVPNNVRNTATGQLDRRTEQRQKDERTGETYRTTSETQRRTDERTGRTYGTSERRANRRDVQNNVRNTRRAAKDQQVDATILTWLLLSLTTKIRLTQSAQYFIGTE